MIDVPPPSYEQTIAAIAKCDIPRSNISIKYEEYLQSDEVTISDLGKMDDAKLRCLKAAVHPFYILTLSEPIQQRAFYDFSQREDRPVEKAAALEWLRARNLMDKVPNHIRGESLESFAERLEAACGLKAGSALEIYAGEFLTMKREVILASDFSKLGKLTECLMTMFAASDASEHGVKFVFVGNEAVAEEKK